MAELLPYRAKDVFAPTDGSGNARGANMGEAQQWGIALESFITNGRFGQPTLAGMTALTKASLSDGDTILVHAEGTGGVFRWDASSTVTSDGGIYIAADEGGTGRWVRQYDGKIAAKWFGVTGDGSTDDTTALNACGQAAKRLGGLNGAHVYLGPGRFKVSTIVVPDGVVFEGDGERTTRFEKVDVDDFSYMAESEGFEDDLAANDFSYGVSSSLNSGFRNCGFYGGKLFTGTDVTGETVVANTIDASGHFEMVVDGGGTITSITGGVKGQQIKLVRGDTDLTVNIGGTDAINETLTDNSPYLFLTYTGAEWRLTAAVGRLAGGVRLYTRRPIMDHVQVFNVLGRGVWLAGPDDGGSTSANEMPEGYIGPIYVYRSSSEGVVVSGFHDAVVKSVNVGTSYYTGLVCERVDGESSCTGEILHAHVYGGRYRGIDVLGPMHFGECIAESNDYEGIRVAYQNTASTGPTWFGTLQVYLNCSDADVGVNAYRQAAFGQPGCVVGKFIASAAGTSAKEVYAADVTANRVQLHGINIAGNANTYALRNSGNYNQFTGVFNGCARGLSVAGGTYCSYRLQMQSCSEQIRNLGGDFTFSTFDISFFASAGSTVWGGALPTASQRAVMDLNVKGKIDTTSYTSKFRAKVDLSLAVAGEVKATVNHTLWYTPDVSEISFGIWWTGANFNFSANATPHAFVGPYADAVGSSSIDVAIYVPTSQASTMTVGVQIS